MEENPGQDVLEHIAKKYQSRNRPNKKIEDKAECDELRKNIARVLANVSIMLNEMNSSIQGINTVDKVLDLVKSGYMNAIEQLSSTLDYASNIQILSRTTKKLKENEG